MATIDSLANETLIKIMEMLKEPNPHSWDNCEDAPGRYAALRAAALVCSRWRDPAQRALFQNVEFSNSFRLRPDRFLASPVELRYHTRSMSVSVNDSALWPKVSGTCRNLNSLKLSIYSFDCEALGRSSFAGLDNLTIVTEKFNYGSLDRGVQLPMALSSLALWTDRYWTASATASSWLRSLERLHLRYPDLTSGPDEIMSFMLEVGPHLRTFILDTSGRYSLANNLQIFSACTSLEYLSWNNSEGLWHLADLQTILDAFPSPATLRHLSIGTRNFTTLEHVIRLFEYPSLSLLTTLEFPLFKQFQTVTEWIPPVADQLARECESRGIQLIIGGVEASGWISDEGVER